MGRAHRALPRGRHDGQGVVRAQQGRGVKPVQMDGPPSRGGPRSLPAQVERGVELDEGDARASVNRILLDSSVHTKSDYIREIMVTFAGMIGTYVMTGDYTDGNCSDLEHIKELASAMADENFLGINNIILHPKIQKRSIEAKKNLSMIFWR